MTVSPTATTTAATNSHDRPGSTPREARAAYSRPITTGTMTWLSARKLLQRAQRKRSHVMMRRCWWSEGEGRGATISSDGRRPGDRRAAPAEGSARVCACAQQMAVAERIALVEASEFAAPDAGPNSVLDCRGLERALGGGVEPGQHQRHPDQQPLWRQ